jgi:hypothetical protein
MTAAPLEWRVSVGGEEISAVYEPAEASEARTVFVCAHGAGGGMADPGLLNLARVMRSHGLAVIRFNFPYRERGSRRPDPMPRLTACVSAVAARARDEIAPDHLILGGRSMGGRAASMLAAEGYACDGLLLLAYPLHPAGQPEKLRVAHLPRLSGPVLCFNGTRDSLCRRDLMEEALKGVAADWTMHWLEGADHSFHVLRSSGRTDADVLAEIGDAAQAWVARLGRATR